MKKLRRVLFIFLLSVLCDTGTAQPTQQTPAKVLEITNILVDACTTPEGENEMVCFKVGPSPININDLRVDGGINTLSLQTARWPNTVLTWIGVAMPPAKPLAISYINSTITCGGALVEPTGGILPAGADVLLVTSTNFDSAAHSFASLADTLFVIFQNPGGQTAGHFRNYDVTVSYRALALIHTPTSSGDTVIYYINQLVDQSGAHNAQDGAGVRYTWEGDATYYNEGCTVPPVITYHYDSICSGQSYVLPDGVPVTSPGTYPVILQSTHGCDSLVTTVLSLNANPYITPTFTALGPYCTGAVPEVLPVTSVNGITGIWTPDSISTSAAGTEIYTFSPVPGQCAATAAMSVSVYEPVPQVIAGSAALCVGSAATWTATTSGGTWSSAGTSVATADSLTGLVTGVASGTSVVSYSVTTAGGCVNTATATVTVSAIAQASISGGSALTCYNTSPGTLTAAIAGGAGGYTYQWYMLPSVIINNATDSTYNPGNLTSGTGYYCIVSGMCGTSGTDTLHITVYPELDAVLSGGTTPICVKTSPGTFTATSSGGTGTYAYQWYKTSSGIINGATSSTYNPGMMTVSNGFYCIVTSSPCGTDTTSAFFVTVLPEVGTPTPITVSGGTEPVCQLTNDTTHTVYSTSASNNLGFHWSVSDTAAGAIDSVTGIMTWANGYYGSVNIQVVAYGCGLPSPQVSYTVVINQCGSGITINGKTCYAAKANTGNPVPNPPSYNAVKYNIDNVIVVLKNYPSGTETARDTSDEQGNYQFINVSNGNYVLSYDKYTADTMQGGNDVNAIDISLVKYFIGADTLSDPSRNFSANYKKAANVDNNTSINAIDIARIKAKVGAPYSIAKNFPRGNWLALDTAVTVAGTDLIINLKTICYGDFNASSTKYRDSVNIWSLAKSLPDKNIVALSDESITISKNEYFELPLRISSAVDDFSAMGLELEYPLDDYKLVSATMPHEDKNQVVKINPTLEEIIADDNDLLVTDEDGVIRVVYATTRHFDVAAGDEVIRLGFRPMKDMSQGILDFELSGTGIFGDQYGEEQEDTYLIMPEILVQGSSADAGFDFAGYPNPFNGHAILDYSLPEDGYVKISVYNNIGEQVCVLVNESQAVGKHTAEFAPRELAQGMYTFKLEFSGANKSKCLIIKMIH